jgi:hypothetical protein
MTKGMYCYCEKKYLGFFKDMANPHTAINNVQHCGNAFIKELYSAKA